MEQTIIELNPTPEAYARCLVQILQSSTNPSDIRWATGQVIGYVKYYAEQNPKNFNLVSNKE